MALLDATPTDSPPGIAIASGAVVAVLLEVLVKERILTGDQARGVVTAAQVDLREYRHRGPQLDDANFVLNGWLNKLSSI